MWSQWKNTVVNFYFLFFIFFWEYCHYCQYSSATFSKLILYSILQLTWNIIQSQCIASPLHWRRQSEREINKTETAHIRQTAHSMSSQALCSVQLGHHGFVATWLYSCRESCALLSLRGLGVLLKSKWKFTLTLHTVRIHHKGVVFVIPLFQVICCFLSEKLEVQRFSLFGWLCLVEHLSFYGAVRLIWLSCMFC